MQYGLYVSAAGAQANSFRQDVISNNLANAETVGFKRDLAMFTSRRTEAAETGQRRDTTALLEGLGGGLFALPTHTDFSPAGLDSTGRDYDVAIEGQGFFQVKQDGETLYTRDGRFARSESNELVMINSQLPVLDEAGAAILLDPAKGDFHISESGMVSQDGEEIARLGLVDFDDTSALVKRGGNLYEAEGADPVAIAAQVKQGYLEQSGVEVTKQMVDMIKTQRMFEANLNMLQLQDRTLGEMIQRFGR